MPLTNPNLIEIPTLVQLLGPPCPGHDLASMDERPETSMAASAPYVVDKNGLLAARLRRFIGYAGLLPDVPLPSRRFFRGFQTSCHWLKRCRYRHSVVVLARANCRFPSAVTFNSHCGATDRRQMCPEGCLRNHAHDEVLHDPCMPRATEP